MTIYGYKDSMGTLRYYVRPRSTRCKLKWGRPRARRDSRRCSHPGKSPKGLAPLLQDKSVPSIKWLAERTEASVICRHNVRTADLGADVLTASHVNYVSVEPQRIAQVVYAMSFVS